MAASGGGDRWPPSTVSSYESYGRRSPSGRRRSTKSATWSDTSAAAHVGSRRDSRPGSGRRTLPEAAKPGGLPSYDDRMPPKRGGRHLQYVPPGPPVNADRRGRHPLATCWSTAVADRTLDFDRAAARRTCPGSPSFADSCLGRRAARPRPRGGGPRRVAGFPAGSIPAIGQRHRAAAAVGAPVAAHCRPTRHVGEAGGMKPARAGDPTKSRPRARSSRSWTLHRRPVPVPRPRGFLPRPDPVRRRCGTTKWQNRKGWREDFAGALSRAR